MVFWACSRALVFAVIGPSTLMKPGLLFKTTRDVGHVDPDGMVKSNERRMSPCKHWELVRDVSNIANRSRDLSRAVEYHGNENLVIYASKKCWFWQNRLYVHLSTSSCKRMKKMADLLTRSPRHILSVDIHFLATKIICSLSPLNWIGIGHPCYSQLTAVKKGSW